MRPTPRTLLLALAALAALACAACTRTNGTTYAVHLNGSCIDPQTRYVRDHVADLDGFGQAHFVMDDDPAAASATRIVTVDCGPTASGAPAELDLPSGRVRFDPVLVPGELATMAIIFHEVGGHWQAFVGPHPERAKVHPCPTADYLGDPSLCNTDHWVDDMNMAPGTPGIGAGNGGWNGDDETLGAVPHSTITLEDAEFVAWATRP